MNKSRVQTMPLASIALATFNGTQFLRQQLDSLIVQTYQGIEIVVSDDQSSDDTGEILTYYSGRYSNISWSKNPEPQGYAKNFERSIRLCKGDVIFLCDQDDIWLPTKIELHMAAYVDQRVAWVYNRVVLIDKYNKEIGALEDTVPQYYKKRTITQAAWGSCILGCATSYRADALMSTLPIGRHARAHDSWFQLMLYSERYCFLDSPLQLYRLHGSNNAGWNQDTTSEQDRKMRDGYIDLLKELATHRNIKISQRILFFFLFLKKTAKKIISRGDQCAETVHRR